MSFSPLWVVCVHSSLLVAPVGLQFVLGCPGGPSTAADPGGPLGLPVLFDPVLGDPGRSLFLSS